MSGSLVVCEVDESLKATMQKFRFRKQTNNAAILSPPEALLVVPRSRPVIKGDRAFAINPLDSETASMRTSVKIDMEKHLIVLEEEYEDISMEQLTDELPAHQPRFIIYSYKYVHDDGRVSYPLCFIFCSPMGCKPEQQMMYAGSKLELVKAAGFTKVFEVRNSEELTEEWLKKQLEMFR